jgi:imidazole glycerol-phosphate synthase subunit HisF
VKGDHLEGLGVLRRPDDFTLAYAADGADEVLCMDVVASLYGRNSHTHAIGRTAREIFVPLTVGGGLRTIDDIRWMIFTVQTASSRRTFIEAEEKRAR